MKDITNDLPLGLGMALAKNIEALNRFSALTPTQKQNFINRTHSITNKKEMDRLVMELTTNGEGFM
ncbi:MAG: hypothetical protein ACI4I4_04090 [Acutalibacteraceae bacterium]